MNILNVFSLLFELTVLLFGLMLAIGKKKNYGWFITFTFAIYIFYDSVRFFVLAVNPLVTSILFCFASASILWAAYRIYEEK